MACADVSRDSGAVAVIDLATGNVRSRIRPLATGSTIARAHFDWPTSIDAHINSRHIFVTESRQLLRVDTGNKRVSRHYRIALCFNLSSVNIVSKDKAIVFDQGVFDDIGAGRLLTLDLKRGRTRVILTTPPYCICAFVSKPRATAYILQRSSAKSGRLYLYDMLQKSWTAQIALPTRPADIVSLPRPNEFCIAGADGLFKLELFP